MKAVLKIKKDKAICIIAIIVLFLAILLISNIINTRKSLERIKENARKEVEHTLISTGLAKYTKEIDEEVTLLNYENLPENTSSTPQPEGTIVRPKANWNIETVTAISVGRGDTVPVPIGFYYVGGDLSTGVIISDNEEDKYDGTIDKTTWEYTTNLKGNQFVWIPCKEEEYVKCEVWNGITQTPSKLASSGWDKATYTAELPQIRKYEGFYVARYEAGLATTIPEFTETQNETNPIYNKEGIAQSRAGVIPWIFIDWYTSQKNALNMYNTNSVSSGLITGTQWDVMLKQMTKRTDVTEADLTNSGNIGNYANNRIKYKGRKARVDYSTGSWLILPFGDVEEGETGICTPYSNGELLTTGASKQTEIYHIFDVAGNVWEWTDEVSLYKANNAKETNVPYRIYRGGEGPNNAEIHPVAYRFGSSLATYSHTGLGFRVTLYIK